jgi:hypothetical protein
MKFTQILTVAFMCCAVFQAKAQPTPKKLAITEVGIAPTMIKKIGAAVPQPTAPQRAKVEFLGVWKVTGPAQRGSGVHSYTITREANDGSLHVVFQDGNGGSLPSASVVNRANHVSVTFTPTYRMHNIEADYDAKSGKFIGVIGGAGPRRELVCSTPFPDSDPSPTVASPVTQAKLDGLTHQIYIQLFDKFNDEGAYAIMSGSELKKSFPPAENYETAPYEFGAESTKEHFKSLGVSYVLVSTIENMQEFTHVVQRTRGAHYQAEAYTRSTSGSWNSQGSYNNSGTGRYNNSGNYNRSGSSSSTSSGRSSSIQGGLDPESWTEQDISISLRLQLYETATGKLKSANRTFNLARNEVAAADQNNRSYDELFLLAGSEASTWYVTIADDIISPMVILSREGDRVKVNRGKQAGLSVGQAFKVWTEERPKKDSVTGEMGEGDPKTLGKIEITEIFPKSSYGRVLEDKGIVTQAKLELLK